MSELHPLAAWIDKQNPKMTRRDFAEAVSISESHLSLFLKGERELSLPAAVRIERFTKGNFTCADLVKEAA
jgi:DNA-binding transcriptional regulator YdaS (Cro superfamily)